MTAPIPGCSAIRSLSLCLCALAFWFSSAVPLAGAEKSPIKLEQTFYYSGDMNGTPWSPGAIAVDSDGSVALAINRTLGPGNFPISNDDKALVLLYDKTGQPVGRVASRTSSMIDVCFGPDARLYTAEGWFDSHLPFERPIQHRRQQRIQFAGGGALKLLEGFGLGRQAVEVGHDPPLVGQRCWDCKLPDVAQVYMRMSRTFCR